MDKINFQNGVTKVNAETFNTFQNNIENGKLENYIVTTNDIKFNDIKEIIGNDNYTDGKPYLITNTPTGNSNYIQNGRRHTIFGLEYDNQKHGYQVSYGTQKILYRTKNNNVWSQWQCLTQNITTGTEYETGRLIDGKKEYGKRINCGNLPNAQAKYVQTGLENITLTRAIDGVMLNSGSQRGLPAPSVTSANTIMVYLNGTGTTLTINTQFNWSSYTAYVELFYVKN